MNRDEAREYARCGLNWLKLKYGDDVADQVDIDWLDMRYGSKCMLGQLEEEYWKGCMKYSLTEADCVQLGFTLDLTQAGDIDDDYETLTNAWRELFEEEQELLA